MAPDLQDLQKQIESYADDDLKRIDCEEADDYVPDALALVNAELARRNIILDTSKEKNDSTETSSPAALVVRRVKLADRFWARTIDFIVVALVAFGIAQTAYFAFSVLRRTEIQWSIFGQSTMLTAGWFLNLLFWPLRDGYRGGKGFGKDVNRIMVINLMDLRPCGYAQSMLRNIISDAATISIAIASSQYVIGRISTLLVAGVDAWRILETHGGRRMGDLVARRQVLYHCDYERITTAIGAHRSRSLLDEELTPLHSQNIECPECGSLVELNKAERAALSCMCSECNQNIDILPIELDNNESRDEEVAA